MSIADQLEIQQYWDRVLKNIDTRSYLLDWGRRIYGIRCTTAMVLVGPRPMVLYRSKSC